ncbi:glycoside hydrolase superfamily [Tricharina praecox]|uniref:glycoside hydrolase superfamily n=1 Tax=Tricharina praecox TaxID=43433 RepID=UPI002220E20F|nr:glycoside hydrolase superfamily [Tricharina praecox]KAI5843171.1 glycoside hydrolase superfamily [Tricharina praecox]
MKFSVPAIFLAFAAAASAAPTTSYFAGFNLGHTHKSGSCKTTAAWTQEFKKIKSWSTGGKGTFNTVKLFSTNDCNALEMAVPAAKAAGVKIWVGVWNTPEDKFNAEKAALERALKAHPDTAKWLAGINVGSESLYRKDVQPWRLAEQIYDVKGMVQTAYKSPNTPVGTADTWTMWVDGANAAVIKACDVVLMNGFPYWQGATIGESLGKFKDAITNTRNAVGINKPFVIGETGHPTKGDNFGNAVASVQNAAAYWKAAACYLQTTNIPWLWFSGFDEPNKSGTIEQNFGVALSNQPLKFSLKC